MAIQQNEIPTIDSYMVNERPQQGSTSAIQSGWDAAASMTPTPTGYAVDFKHSEKPQVVKFLDQNGPFSSYKQHFLSEKSGMKGYVCIGITCPLCNVLKSRAEIKRGFSVVNLSSDPVQRQRIIASPRFFNNLHMVNATPQGPLTNGYWAISRTGVKQSTTYHVMHVKARDLLEDYGIDPQVAEAKVAEFKPFTADSIKEHSYAELLEIAESLV